MYEVEGLRLEPLAVAVAAASLTAALWLRRVPGVKPKTIFFGINSSEEKLKFG